MEGDHQPGRDGEAVADEAAAAELSRGGESDCGDEELDRGPAFVPRRSAEDGVRAAEDVSGDVPGGVQGDRAAGDRGQEDLQVSFWGRIRF